MPRGPSEAVVTKFLRHALAAHPCGVTELDAKAQAAGLLNERQSITTARVFKRAKKSLGITSRRTGFGAQSKWHWQMPPPEQQNENSVEARPESRCLHVAFQSIGSRGSAASTMVNLPVTSRGIDGASS